MSEPVPLALRLGRRLIALAPGRSFTVGSAAGCDLRLQHDSVAARHLLVAARQGSLEVKDLGSPSGFQVDGVPLRVAVLTPGQHLRIGRLTLEVVAAAALTAAERLGNRRPPPSFHHQVAAELARTPWFVLSLAVHLALLFGLSTWFRYPPPGDSPYATATIVHDDDDTLVDDRKPPDEDIEIEVVEDVQLQDPTTPANFAPEQAESLTELEFSPNLFGSGLGAKLGGRRGAEVGDILAAGSEALRTGGLRKTVTKLRETGLEIVFVFDSTGSMGPVLIAAKERIFRMVDVLHALVPTARIGIVTYRDHGRRETYVTRQVPVTRDVYRVMNFMESIEASGGGDVEEAVFEGLSLAIKQPWLSDSRRVVVLIGDAPPHAEDSTKLRNTVRSFTRRGTAQVHAIATSDRGRIDPATRTAFAEIAELGGGEFAPFEKEAMILQQVLSLAFGSEYRKDLGEVYDLVELRNRRADIAALDTVKRADLAAVERGLRRRPVDDDMVKALIRIAEPAVTRWLIERLGDGNFPAHSRQAAAFAVMKILGLRRPPLDADADDPKLGPGEIKELLARVQ